MLHKIIRLIFLSVIAATMMVCSCVQAAEVSATEISSPSAIAAPQNKLSMSALKAKAGRVLVLFTHPRLPDRMWAGTSHGGLWQSIDAGNTWMSASVQMQNLTVSSITADPANPDIIYVGTGDGRSNEAALRGQGMFKSEDGGANWKRLPLTYPSTVGENWSHINFIAINSTGVVLAATSDNSRNGFIYRSIDGGQTWGLFPVYAGSKVGPHNMVHKISFDPANPEASIFMDDYANVTYSSDGGASWNVVRKSSTSCK